MKQKDDLTLDELLAQSDLRDNAQRGAVSPANNLPELLRQYEAGTPDYAKLQQLYNQPVQERPQSGWERFSDLIDAAVTADTGRGLGYALSAGNKALHAQEAAMRQKMMGDLLNIAKDTRKYKMDEAKLHAKKIQDKFNPVTGEIVRFQDGHAVGAGGMGGGAGAGSRPGFTGVSAFANTPVGQREAFQAELQRYNKQIEHLEKQEEETNLAANSAGKRLGTVRLLKQLLPDFYSGTGANVLHAFTKPFGDKSAEAAETFDALAHELILGIAQTQKGPQSDSDMALIKTATPGSNKNKASNINLLNIAEAVDTRTQQYAEAMNAWINSGRDPKEFETTWQKYANSFPLIQKISKGELGLEPTNLENWQIIFDPQFEEIIKAYKPITQKKPFAKTERPNTVEIFEEDIDPYAGWSADEIEARLRELRGK